MLGQLNLRRKSLHRKNFSRKALHRSFESLEARQVMAGNVTATVDNLGHLLITGDSAANGIYLTQVAEGQFEVHGFDAGGSATTINGGNAAVTLSGVTGNISIINGNGDDIVQLDYLNHTGNLSIDALEGHDLINIGTSNKASNLVGDLTLGYGQTHIVNLLNTNVVGKMSAKFTGPTLATVTAFPANAPLNAPFNRSPFVNSYAITGCSFSSDVTIEGYARAIQAFIESTSIGGKLTIENGSETLNSPSRLTEYASFIVLNNVSMKTGLEVEIFSSTSFVMNNCVVDTPGLIPGDDAELVSNARIALYGKTNIYQISNSTFKGNLETLNAYFDPNPVMTDVFPTQAPTPLYKSTYDIVQLNNVTCEHVAAIISNGTLSVKHSTFDTLYAAAKKLVRFDEVDAKIASVSVFGVTGRTNVSISGSEFEELQIGCNVRSIHSFNVKLVDTVVTGTTSIVGRGDLEITNPLEFETAPVLSSAAANVVVEKCTLGLFFYSYRTTEYPLGQPTETTYEGLYGGTGRDKLTIRESTINEFFAQLGAGKDSLTFEESKILGRGRADGGAGNDKLSIDAASDVSKADFINFENGTGSSLSSPSSSAGTITVGNGGSVSSGGVVALGGTMLDGTLNVGAISYTGATNVNPGTLTIAGNGNLGTLVL